VAAGFSAAIGQAARPRPTPVSQRVRTSDFGGTSTVVPVLNFTLIGVLRALYAR